MKKELIIKALDDLSEDSLENAYQYILDLPKRVVSDDFIKENLSDSYLVYKYIINDLRESGFSINERSEGNIAIENSVGRKTCYIDMLSEYKYYGHPVARFSEKIPINDDRIVPFDRVNGKFGRRRGIWLKEGHEKYNIGITCDSDYELVKEACKKIH